MEELKCILIGFGCSSAFPTASLSALHPSEAYLVTAHALPLGALFARLRAFCDSASAGAADVGAYAAATAAAAEAVLECYEADVDALATASGLQRLSLRYSHTFAALAAAADSAAPIDTRLAALHAAVLSRDVPHDFRRVIGHRAAMAFLHLAAHWVAHGVLIGGGADFPVQPHPANADELAVDARRLPLGLSVEAATTLLLAGRERWTLRREITRAGGADGARNAGNGGGPRRRAAKRLRGGAATAAAAASFAAAVAAKSGDGGPTAAAAADAASDSSSGSGSDRADAAAARRIFASLYTSDLCPGGELAVDEFERRVEAARGRWSSALWARVGSTARLRGHLSALWDALLCRRGDVWHAFVEASFPAVVFVPFGGVRPLSAAASGAAVAATGRFAAAAGGMGGDVDRAVRDGFRHALRACGLAGSDGGGGDGDGDGNDSNGGSGSGSGGDGSDEDRFDEADADADSDAARSSPTRSAARGGAGRSDAGCVDSASPRRLLRAQRRRARERSSLFSAFSAFLEPPLGGAAEPVAVRSADDAARVVLQRVNRISVAVALPDGVRLVVTPAALGRYRALFAQHMALRFSLHALQACRRLASARPTFASGAARSKGNTTTAASAAASAASPAASAPFSASAEVAVLVHRLTFVISNYLYYLQMDVQEAHLHSARRALNSAHSVDAARNAHDTFVARAFAGAFLNESSDDGVGATMHLACTLSMSLFALCSLPEAAAVLSGTPPAPTAGVPPPSAFASASAALASAGGGGVDVAAALRVLRARLDSEVLPGLAAHLSAATRVEHRALWTRLDFNRFISALWTKGQAARAERERAAERLPQVRRQAPAATTGAQKPKA